MLKQSKLLGLIALLLLSNLSYSQTRKELEKQRRKTEEEIAVTKKILKETKAKKQQSIREITTIARLIEKREELIQTINQEIVYVNNDVDKKKNDIESLNIQIDQEKQNYAKALVQAYKNKKVYNHALYFFAAQSFNQFVQRMKFNSYLNAAQEKFLFRIHQKREQLEFALDELLGLKTAKEALAKNKQNGKEQSCSSAYWQRS